MISSSPGRSFGPIAVLIGFFVGAFVGLTYSFALQARTTTATVTALIGRFGLEATKAPGSRRPSPGRADNTPAPSPSDGLTLMERLERDGEVHYTKPA